MRLFFFQAEDGIRDGHVTGVQTCALPILKDLEDVQTWEEQGVDVIFPHWRGIIGPPNMSDEEINYWDEKMEEMAETEGWNEVLDNNEWETFYKSSSESKEFLAEQTEHYDELLKLSGLK